MAQGLALQDKIAGAWASLSEMEAFRLEQPWWLPFGLFPRVASAKAASLLVPSLRREDPGMLERLEGIAYGAQMPLRNLCLLNAMEAFLSSLEGRTGSAPLPGACSAVAIRGSRSRTGEPVIARNFDYVPSTQPYFTMRVSRPKAGWRSLEFLVAPQAGAVDGVNEKGLCITLNYAFLKESGSPGPLITMAIADALAHCDTVPAAVDRIARRARWGAGMLMLADASGQIASLELAHDRSAVRHPADGEDFLVHTNVCQCKETLAAQVPDDAVFTGRVPAPLQGKSVLSWHRGRACRIEDLVRAQAVLGPDELAAIMADHGPDQQPSGSTPCVHTDYWRTTACLQWFPARQAVRVSYTTACAARYVDLAF